MTVLASPRSFLLPWYKVPDAPYSAQRSTALSLDIPGQMLLLLFRSSDTVSMSVIAHTGTSALKFDYLCHQPANCYSCPDRHTQTLKMCDKKKPVKDN